MRVATLNAIAFGSLATALPTPALASTYADAVETAVFSLCPDLRSGRISPEQLGELTRLGYRRTPEVEEDWADVEDGAPFIFVRGSETDAIKLAYWPYPQLCSVIFDGDQGAAALAQVRARISREPRAYRYVEEASWASQTGRHDAWRVARRRPMCLAIDTPARGGDTGYEVTYEPLPPRHPGLALSSCAPAHAPQ